MWCVYCNQACAPLIPCPPITEEFRTFWVQKPWFAIRFSWSKWFFMNGRVITTVGVWKSGCTSNMAVWIGKTWQRDQKALDNLEMALDLEFEFGFPHHFQTWRSTKPPFFMGKPSISMGHLDDLIHVSMFYPQRSHAVFFSCALHRFAGTQDVRSWRYQPLVERMMRRWETVAVL